MCSHKDVTFSGRLKSGIRNACQAAGVLELGKFQENVVEVRCQLRNINDIKPIAGFIHTTAEGSFNIRLRIIKIAYIGMGCLNARGLTLINSALPDERPHIAILIQLKDFKVDITVGSLQIASTCFGINIGCIRAACDK